ncbi:MAG: hypothetical protein RLZZ297_2113 [Chloroflexota bacterium]|jgi:endonuclease/exonuclease/phosphatase family metal-dependent hydrolase
MRALIVVVCLVCTVLTPHAVPVAAADPQLTVMSRNLYLGADVYAAAQRLPDVAAMAQFLWTQQQSTAFAERADALAAEITAARPDVIGLQEAAQWYCRPAYSLSTDVVIDYTALLLEALASRGVHYQIARATGAPAAQHIGFSVPPVPWVTMVSDPARFATRYGSDRAACGFSVADVILVRADAADAVVRSGVSDYVYDYTLVPGMFDMNRGYAWIDLRVGSQHIRIVSTHVEAFYYAGLQPYSIRQVDQLIRDFRSTTGALVVLGDFNNDPRDPVPSGVLNTGGMLPASPACPAQRIAPTVATARTECNTYWLMRGAGFADAGPDALDPNYRTWGYRADLAGPALQRILESSLATAPDGLTTRLDYIFVRGPVTVHQARVVGNGWPHIGWPCHDDTQRAASAFAAQLLTGAVYGAAMCAPSDHAGVVATLSVGVSPVETTVPPTQYAHTYTVVLVAVVFGGALWWWRVRRVRRRRFGRWTVVIRWRRG